MSFGLLGTKNGATENLNITYTVVYHSSTTFKVSLSTDLNGAVTPSTVWILNNGNVVALYATGTNYTGTEANNILLGYFADLETLNVFALQESTVSTYFHSAGTSTAKIGTNSFTVTDYVANATPETVPTCFSETATLNSYNVYLGTPSGSNLEIVTYSQFSGTLTTPFGTNTLDYTYQVTALTVA